jgi:hypothetical protein
VYLPVFHTDCPVIKSVTQISLSVARLVRKSDIALSLLHENLLQSAADDSKLLSNYSGFLYFVFYNETFCA